ncbi:MAG: transposase [Thermomicrobiales bacterium]
MVSRNRWVLPRGLRMSFHSLLPDPDPLHRLSLAADGEEITLTARTCSDVAARRRDSPCPSHRLFARLVHPRLLVQVGDLHTELQTPLELLTTFAALPRKRDEGESSAQLDQWMAEAAGSGIAAMRAFATKVRQDRAAVLAALTLPHSQGQTEGQVNKLKLVKRAMYERAKFDVLRQRILYPAN